MALTTKISKKAILDAIGSGKVIAPGEYDLGDGEFLRVEPDRSRFWEIGHGSNRMLHREDGPAIEYSNGRMEWLQNNVYHREDGPAITDVYGNQWWHRNRALHRVGGPAIDLVNGYRAWYKRGALYRKDGPAVEMPDLDSIVVPTPSPLVAAKMKAFESAWLLGCLSRGWYSFGEGFECQLGGIYQDLAWHYNGLFHCADGPAVRDIGGGQTWYRYGLRHSRNAPSMISRHRELWYLNDLIHRDDGPAEILKYRGKTKAAWYAQGRLHRVGAPAVEYENGTREWWIDGQLHRDDGPAYETPRGVRKWYRQDRLHREDGPAIIKSNGTQEWWLNGKRHRTDGPAIARSDGNEWWIAGKRVPETALPLASTAT